MSRLDVVDTMLVPESRAVARELRGQKPELAEQLQDYYEAVFDPNADSAKALSRTDRLLIAERTASHTNSAAAIEWYAAQARQSDAEEAAIAAAMDVSSPFKGDPRLRAIMRHVDLIVLTPVESTQADIEVLEAAGLSPTGIVAVSQVVAYVSYQVRLIAALRALGMPT